MVRNGLSLWENKIGRTIIETINSLGSRWMRLKFNQKKHFFASQGLFLHMFLIFEYKKDDFTVSAWIKCFKYSQLVVSKI